MTPLIIIPARQFSRGTPGKNRRRPDVPVEWPIVIATDDPLMADTTCPVYLRPVGDDGPMEALIVRVLQAHDDPAHDVIVIAQADSQTVRRAHYIRRAVHALTLYPEATSVVSVVPWVGEPPQKACYLTLDGYLEVPTDAPSRRQDCAPAYRRDGTVYAVRAEYARRGDLYGPRPIPLLVTPADSVTVD